MKRLGLAVLVLVLLASCGPKESSLSVDPNKGEYHYSPDLHLTWIPNSVYEHGIYLEDSVFGVYIITDKEEITSTLLEWMDLRVMEWKILRADSGKDLQGIAWKHTFYAIDDFHFKCAASNTGLCVGSYFPGVVEGSLYETWRDDVYPPAYAPPHTVKYGDEIAQETGNQYWYNGMWYGGIISIGNIGFPVVPHELDHAIGISH